MFWVNYITLVAQLDAFRHESEKDSRLATLCRANSVAAAFGFKCKPLQCIRSRSHLQLLLLQQSPSPPRLQLDLCLSLPCHSVCPAFKLLWTWRTAGRLQGFFRGYAGKRVNRNVHLGFQLPGCLGKRVLRPICSLTRKTNWTISQMDGVHLFGRWITKGNQLAALHASPLSWKTVCTRSLVANSRMWIHRILEI